MSKSPAKRRYLRPEAAEYIGERLGVPVSPRPLEGWPIPFLKVGSRAVYDEADLDREIDRILNQSPWRMNVPPPQKKRPPRAEAQPPPS